MNQTDKILLGQFVSLDKELYVLLFRQGNKFCNKLTFPIF